MGVELSWDLKVCIYPNIPLQAGFEILSLFKRSKADLNSGFSFAHLSCRMRAKEFSIYNYLPIPSGRRDGFMPFPQVKAQNETQTASSMIWTSIANFIFYDDNPYVMSALREWKEGKGARTGRRKKKWGRRRNKDRDGLDVCLGFKAYQHLLVI